MDRTTELLRIRNQLSAAMEAVDRLLDEARPPAQVGKSDYVQSLERTKAIEWLLREAGEPMRPVRIWAGLRRYGRNDPKMEIQVTTYDLWRRGRIGKVDRGLYVSLPDAN